MPARYILAVLGSMGMAIVYGLKVNLSVAMVGMLNHTAIKMAAREEEGLLQLHVQNETGGGDGQCEGDGASGHAEVGVLCYVRY